MPKALLFSLLTFSTSMPPPTWNKPFPKPAITAQGTKKLLILKDKATKAHPAAANIALRLILSASKPIGICIAKAQKL